MNNKTYAVYRGDEYLFEGTLTEICKRMHWQRSTARWYTYPAAKRRAGRARKNRYNRMIVFVEV